MNAKVYFTRQLTPEALLRLYAALGVKLEGKVAVKLHSGEPGNPDPVVFDNELQNHSI